MATAKSVALKTRRDVGGGSGEHHSQFLSRVLVLTVPGQRDLSVTYVTTCFPQLPLEDKLPAFSLIGPDFKYCSLLGECHF